jgi:hypothetical protein
VIENFPQTSFESANNGKGIGIYSGSVLLTSWLRTLLKTRRTMHRFPLEVNYAALVTESAGGPALAPKVWICRTSGCLSV